MKTKKRNNPSTSVTRNRTYQNTSQSLQERLHTLLTRLSDSIEILKKWPESQTGDDSTSVHVETTNKLIASIHKVVEGIKLVEEKTSTNLGEGEESSEQDIALADKLRQAAVPMDLLDMMDYPNRMNPDCFARGMLREALRQMKNLQRRKRLLKMLALAVQNGIKEQESASSNLSGLAVRNSEDANDVEDKTKNITGNKRKKESTDNIRNVKPRE